MHHNTKFGNQILGGLEDIIWTNTDILTLHCAFDLECSYPIFFHKTLRLMMTYLQTKFGCKEINSSRDIVESYFDHMSPCCDHDTLAHNAASPYQVW